MANSNKSGNGWTTALAAVVAAGISVVAVLCTSMLGRMEQMERAEVTQAARWEKEVDRWLKNREKIDTWIGKHDRTIEARDAYQWGRIWALERFAFGKATPMTVAPGEEP